MVHGDDKGLRLPPKVTPTQVVIVPILRKDSNPDNILNYINNLKSELKQNDVRLSVDMREKLSPGHKFNEWEMKGVPIRIEVGPRDMENNELVICRRDDNTKQTVSINEATNIIINLLDEIQNNLFDTAKQFMDDHTSCVETWDEFKEHINNGFVICGWDGNYETEKKIKEETKATIRCLPFEQNIENIKCIYSGNDAKYLSIFSKAY